MSGKKAREKRNGITNTPGKCIFCGNAGNISKQHIWPDWLKNVYPRVGNSFTNEVYGERIERTGPKFFHHKKQYQGHQGVTKVRKVCVSCNGGWISKIENNMKPIFSALLKNESVTIDSDQQRLLANWVIIATIVGEIHLGGRQSIPNEDREYLYRNLLPPAGWKVWIAKNGGQLWQAQSYQNRKIALSIGPIDTTNPATPNPFNAQLAIFGIGSLLLIACKNPLAKFDLDFERLGVSKLFQMHPIVSSIIEWDNCPTLNDLEINALFDVYKLALTNAYSVTNGESI